MIKPKLANRCKSRRARVRKTLKQNGVDALLVTNERNVTYLTGFSGDSSYLILGRKRDLIISDGRYTTQLEEECPKLESHIRETTGISMAGAVGCVLGKLGIATCGFESANLSVSAFAALEKASPDVEFCPTSDIVERFRECKDDDEILEIRQAIGYAERGFDMLRAGFRIGESEKDVSDRLEAGIRRAGAVQSSFDIIVAAGPRGALPHAHPGATVIEERVPVLVDWGAAGRFYRSDLTRLVTTRKILPKLADIYEVVLKAQKAAISKIRPGARAKSVDIAARRLIEQAGYKGRFNHSAGHGIGLDVHEGPMLRSTSTALLEPGMVITVEPGIYIPGWGGVRIEDMVLVTDDGHEVLTSVPKELESILLDV